MRRDSRFLPLALILAAAPWSTLAQPPATSRVRLGVDVLAARGFDTLAGQRVGLITNPTGVASDLRSTIDLLHAAQNVKLTVLFGPEHGVRGDAPAGEHVEDGKDAATGLPTRSLYGKTRKPTAEMLADVDVLVFDIQDIGSRSYTYISTMAVTMEAAAENGKKFVVLDRPNPLGGQRVEGRPADMKFQSFVGYLPIPYVHGLTVGELAQMINGEGWSKNGATCDLTVVAMEGWTRDMDWDATGLPWTPTSPHIPRADSSYFYAATGIVGELNTLSIGVGYTLPFELVGRPGLDAAKLAADLNGRRLAGVHFRPMYFQPFYARFEKELCGGVQIYLTDRRAVELTAVQFHVIDAVRKLDAKAAFFGEKRDAMFDKVCGTDEMRKLLSNNAPLDIVLDAWRDGVDEFRAKREKYLLYR